MKNLIKEYEERQKQDAEKLASISELKFKVGYHYALLQLTQCVS